MPVPSEANAGRTKVCWKPRWVWQRLWVNSRMSSWKSSCLCLGFIIVIHHLFLSLLSHLDWNRTQNSQSQIDRTLPQLNTLDQLMMQSLKIGEAEKRSFSNRCFGKAFGSRLSLRCEQSRLQGHQLVTMEATSFRPPALEVSFTKRKKRSLKSSTICVLHCSTRCLCILEGLL